MQAQVLVETLGVIWVGLEWVIRLVALFVVPRNRKPTSGTAWLLFIFLFPYLGVLLFLVIGSPKLPQARRDAQKNLDRTLTQLLDRLRKDHAAKDMLSARVRPQYASIASLGEALGHMPVFGGNTVEILPEYNDVISRIVTDIDAAKQYVYLEYFIVALDDTTEPIFAALARAVQRGVVVRVMYDSLSTRRSKQGRLAVNRLVRDGVLVQPMLPLKPPGKGYVRPDLRNHRKIFVADGGVAYTGSLNLIQRNYHRKDDIYYDELVVRVRGPIVLQLAAVCASDWYAETGELLFAGKVVKRIDRISMKTVGNTLAQVLPSGPGYDDENNLKLFTSLLYQAKQRIVIVNPYFVPDEALMTAITSAARRGVEVIMINSEAIDQRFVGHAQRSFYMALLEAGVKIYLYKAPILLHSKFMTIDGQVAAVGSSNLDLRSFTLNLEVTLVVYDAKVVRKLQTVEDTYLQRSKQLLLTDWQKRAKHHQLFDSIARLTSALQ